MEKSALIAMSGGVDSSVAALLMKEQGYSCIGATMKLYSSKEAGPDREEACGSADDTKDARAAASAAGIPYCVRSFREDFVRDVIDPFIRTYENGGTPNPCIACNRHLKFGKLLDLAGELGCEFLATGHYVRLLYNETTGRYELHRAKDTAKDQSYVLYTLSQEQLAHAKFPLGEYTKAEIREIARAHGFANYGKPDSQDICFIPDGRYADFICRYTGKEYPEGDFTDENGKTLGRHKGIIHYTVGQRRGLGLSLPEPLYVSEIDPESNTVKLGRNEDLFSSELDAEEINLISVSEIDSPLHVTAKIRYGHREAPATVIQTSEDSFHLRFKEPQRAVTKGQSVVLYQGDTLVGGGKIVRSA